MTWLRSTVGLIITGLSILLLVAAFLWLQSCQQSRQRAAQSRVDRSQGDALRNSAADAVNTVGGVAANQAAGAAIGRQNEEEIRNAKGANQRVDPDANTAGLRALCRRRSHINDPACRVFKSDP